MQCSLDTGTSPTFEIEIVTDGNRAQEIARLILDAPHTSSVGDGLVAGLPMAKVVRMRTKALAKAGEA
jgi:nitrogen regulatory protein PII